jgi:Kef-type K+ transport system membrane component KefB
LLAWFPDPKLAVYSFGLRASLAWGVGVLLGLVALSLASRGIKRDEMWGILVGTSLLAIGVSARLGLSSVAAAFAMGLTLGVASRRRAELAAMLRPTERAVLLPLAVLAGALIDVRQAPAIAWLIPLALIARFAAELVRGAWLLIASRSARRAGPLVGYNLLSTGDVSLACAISIALSFEQAAALSVLAVASAGVLMGELLAPLALERSLRRAGELGTGAGEPWSRASDAPEGIQL